MSRCLSPNSRFDVVIDGGKGVPMVVRIELDLVHRQEVGSQAANKQFDDQAERDHQHPAKRVVDGSVACFWNVFCTIKRLVSIACDNKESYL